MQCILCERLLVNLMIQKKTLQSSSANEIDIH